jgi:hypothetical protein
MEKYIEPKVGDKVICAQLEEDEDFGMSGIVLKGVKNIVVGEEYTITSVDTSQVPERGNTWTKEEYPMIQWYWTMCGIVDKKGRLIHPRMCLGNTFKRS